MATDDAVQAVAQWGAGCETLQGVTHGVDIREDIGGGAHESQLYSCQGIDQR